MRIISKFKDYYDCIQRYAFDDDTVYVRNEKEYYFNPQERKWTPELPGHLGLISPPYAPRSHISLEKFTIGFCGTIYPGVKIWKNDSSQCHYCLESFWEYLEDNKILPKPWKCNSKKRIKTHQNRIKAEWDFYFKPWKNEKAFLKLRTPVFSFKVGIRYTTDSICTVNPLLNEYEFFKIFNPYSAYQEIDMFLNSILTSPEPEMIEISNENLLKKKGFDEKSFRKQKKRS